MIFCLIWWVHYESANNLCLYKHKNHEHMIIRSNIMSPNASTQLQQWTCGGFAVLRRKRRILICIYLHTVCWFNCKTILHILYCLKHSTVLHMTIVIELHTCLCDTFNELFSIRLLNSTLLYNNLGWQYHGAATKNVNVCFGILFLLNVDSVEF